MRLKRLSVIIPIYNVGEYLDKCIYSVVNQTYTDLEIILVDDASTDDSGRRCDLWKKKDKRIEVIHKQKNEGHAKARNEGVGRCTGEYLAFLDSDDWWELTYAQKMIKTLEKSNADITICDIYYENNGTKEVSEIRMQSDTIYYPYQNPEVVNLARTFLWGKVYKAQFYQSLKIRQPEIGYDDLAVVPYVVAKANRIARCQNPLYHYLRHRVGNTVDDLSKIDEVENALEIVIELFKKDGIFEEFKIQLERLCFGQVRFAIRKIGGLCMQFQNSINNLYSLMDREFPGWFNPDGKSFLVYGGKEQADILSLILFREKRITLCPSKQEERVCTDEYDYVLKNIPKQVDGWAEKWNIADRLYQLFRKSEKQNLEGKRTDGCYANTCIFFSEQ